jgi:hypothetical protein
LQQPLPPPQNQLQWCLQRSPFRVQRRKSGLEWGFKGPQAELTDEAGRTIGKHYGGPTWEASDASKVVARLVSSADSQSRAAIPQLLLVSTQNSGTGVLTNVKNIQRLQTGGGLAPKEPCQKDGLGPLAQSPYKAVYYFMEMRASRNARWLAAVSAAARSTIRLSKGRAS